MTGLSMRSHAGGVMDARMPMPRWTSPAGGMFPRCRLPDTRRGQVARPPPPEPHRLRQGDFQRGRSLDQRGRARRLGKRPGRAGLRRSGLRNRRLQQRLPHHTLAPALGSAPDQLDGPSGLQSDPRSRPGPTGLPLRLLHRAAPPVVDDARLDGTLRRRGHRCSGPRRLDAKSPLPRAGDRRQGRKHAASHGAGDRRGAAGVLLAIDPPRPADPFHPRHPARAGTVGTHHHRFHQRPRRYARRSRHVVQRLDV